MRRWSTSAAAAKAAVNESSVFVQQQGQKGGDRQDFDVAAGV
jgi:hypothetical protein